MKKVFLIVLCFGAMVSASAQHAVKQKVEFPKTGNYLVLTGDFHIHTIFSDGHVTPAERVSEAYHHGLDVMSITDHLEIQSHKDVTTASDRNRSYELSKEAAKAAGIINIKGTEITRQVQPGHANAIFIKDAMPLFNPTKNANPSAREGFEEAVKMATSQGGFVFYNHPFHNLPDHKITMPQEVGRLIKSGDIQGIEVVNGDRFSKEGYNWAMENNLTLIANSDVHTSMPLAMSQHDITHRASTLIFVKERSEQGVKEALEAHRTLIWWRDYVIGRKELLREFVMACCPVVDYTFKDNQLSFRVTNNSPQKFTMEPISTEEFFIAHPMVLQPDTETKVGVKVKTATPGDVTICFRVTNAWTNYQEPIFVEYTFKR